MEGVYPEEWEVDPAVEPRSLQRKAERRPTAIERFDFPRVTDAARLTEPDVLGTVAVRRCSRTERSKGRFTSMGSSIGTKFSSGKR
jgi:hypothetical protein